MYDKSVVSIHKEGDRQLCNAKVKRQTMQMQSACRMVGRGGKEMRREQKEKMSEFGGRGRKRSGAERFWV